MEMEQYTTSFFDAVVEAMAPAEDIGGPEGHQYRLLMEAIIREAQGRIAVFQSHDEEAALTDRDLVIVWAARRSSFEGDEIVIQDQRPTYMAEEQPDWEEKGVWLDARIYLHPEEVETALQHSIDSGYITAAIQAIGDTRTKE